MDFSLEPHVVQLWYGAVLALRSLGCELVKVLWGEKQQKIKGGRDTDPDRDTDREI